MTTKSLHVKQADLKILELISNGYTAKQVASMHDKPYHVISGRIEDLRVEMNAKNTTHLIVMLILKNVLHVDLHAVEEKATSNRPPAEYSNVKSLYPRMS